MPRIHGALWAAAWQATLNYNRWHAEHNPVIAHASKAPSSPVFIAAVKDRMREGLLDLRQVGAWVPCCEQEVLPASVLGQKAWALGVGG